MGDRDPVDLNDLARDNQYSVTVQKVGTPEEVRSRLRREEADAVHRRRIFWAVFGLVVFTLLVCIWIILAPGSTAETQEWARAGASAIIGGLVGYFGGRVGTAGAV